MLENRLGKGKRSVPDIVMALSWAPFSLLFLLSVVTAEGGKFMNLGGELASESILPREETPPDEDKLFLSKKAGGGIPTEDQMKIVDIHNKFRKGVSPSASNMKTMVWDASMAKTAQNYADQCKFAHNANRGFTGENIYWHSNSGDVVKGVTSWHNEVKDYTYDTNSCAKGKVCGHYTQVVWADSAQVGCGLTKCEKTEGIPWEPSSGYLFVCNYAPPGNWKGEWPYNKA